MRIRSMIMAAASAVVVGCSQPTIDATSMAAGTASIEAIEATLSDTERERFRSSAGYLMYRVAGDDISQDDKQLSALKALDGKSAKKIISEAQQKLQDEIAELEPRAAAYRAALAGLSGVAVSGQRYERSVTSGGVRTRIFATLTNSTELTLAQLRFDYALTTPGRSIPWTTGNGTFVISGGLEPGEQREESPIGLGVDHDFIVVVDMWQKHPDAVLQITFTDAADASRSSILPAGTSKYVAERLETLQRTAEKVGAHP